MGRFSDGLDPSVVARTFKSDKAVDYELQAKVILVNVYNEHSGVITNIDGPEALLTVDEVFVVWFSKTLENWKCLLATTKRDGMYYELTHSGAKKETYVDAYYKTANICVPD